VPSTLLVYDYVISIDREIEYIWNRPRTTTTILYLIVRYFGTRTQPAFVSVFLSNVSGENLPDILAGKIFLAVQGWPSCGVLWLVQTILQLRLYVLYDRSRRVLLFMGSGFVVEIMAMAAILAAANATSGC
ncbi:hypothetical protein EDD16DRAFT_1597843, partial [Pisolithus croceorrhizus]